MKKLIFIIFGIKISVFGFCFEEAAATYGFLPSTLWTIAKIESNLNPNDFNKNRNGTVDIGLMQVNSANLEDLKRLGYDYGNDIWEPCTNVMVGAWILKKCYDKFGESWKTIDCYNKGSGRAKDYSQYTDKFMRAFGREYGYAAR